MTPIIVVDAVPPSALVFGAHPDDAELFAGGALAKWIARGCAVSLVVCTSGDAGAGQPGATRPRTATQRREEQFAAARVLGIHDLVMMDFPDGGLEDTVEFRRRVVEMVRKFRPHTVFTHEPHRPGALVHRDHRIVGTVVQDAVYPFARDALHFPEQVQAGLAPHKVRDVLLWDTDDPNCIINTTGFTPVQAAALSCHRSQLDGLECGARPLAWLENRAGQAAAGWTFERGELFRRLVAPV